MEQFTRTCGHCLTEFITQWPTAEYCSRTHKERARQHRKRGRRTQGVVTLHVRICKGCATHFTTDNTAKVYCSEQCREWTKSMVRAQRDREYNNAKTPALKARLYWRDSGLCGICKQLVDTSLKYPDPMSFSIDHIIPRSVKADHSFKNLRTTHLECNLKRSDKPA